jgi:hypothetical protein
MFESMHEGCLGIHSEVRGLIFNEGIKVSH